MAAPAVAFFYPRPARYGINAVAGALEAGGDFSPPALHFLRGEADLLAQVPALRAGHGRAIVAFSLLSAFAPRAAALVAALRREAPPGALLFVAGGPHAGGDPAGTLALGFDVAVTGEGEETFRDLVRAWGEAAPLDAIAGLALPGPGGAVRHTPSRSPVDLDRFPAFAAAHHKLGPIEISRGCPFGCPFCQTSYHLGRRMRHRSAASVARHVGLLAANGVRDVRFITPNAFAWGTAGAGRPDPARLEELLAAVRSALPRPGRIFFGSFPSEVRPEFVTPETVALVRRYAANTMLVIGAQSGSPAQLEALGRGHDVEDVRRAVACAVGAGLVPYVDLIFGLPGEREGDRRLSIALARELAAAGAVIHAHPFLPLPGTPWATEPARPLDPTVCRALSELAARGALHGDWRRKEAEALGTPLGRG
ncbi:MAG TPA: TIGR04013 family B12-binding domain/radical SAM domain-containing protein [Candidatus Methanoperedens sp.]|nr:TIGR04013 family B12-binding domain/radical SAM domain-containing protein [Candidatus Methanoperedens sp.]